MNHKMSLRNKPFNNIKSGTKTIELRLYDEKRKLISVGDTITFTNIDSLEDIKVLVLDLHIYDSFEELYKHFDKASLGYKKDELASYKDIEEYYSKKEQSKYRVVGIEIKVE